MSIRHIVIAGALMLATATASAADQAQSSRTAGAPKDGSIAGRITASDTGRPLRRAQVTLRSVSASGNVPPIAASTNSGGQYEAKGVPPGSYFVSAGRAGYLTLQYGQRRPGDQGLSVTVREGEVTKDIDIGLPRGAVLAGTITDELGDPYPGVSVDALGLRYDRGRRVPTPIAGTTTNDLGQFRIAGLEPGRYYVVANSTETWKGERGQVFGYGSTYFPGGPADRAQVVTLALSEVKRDLHFTLHAGRAARVSGRVQRETGEPAASVGVGLAYSYPGGIVSTFGMRSTRTGSDGSFVFTNVTPGVYSVDARSGAEQVVTVAGGDIEGVALVPKTGSTVTGTVVTDEGFAPPFSPSGVRVLLEAPDDDVLPTVRVVSVDTDWSFKLSSLGGHFLFRVLGIPDGWMLGAVRIGDKDITDAPWDVPTGGREFGGMQIVVTRKVGRVSGVVQNADGKTTSAGTIVVFAEDRDLWVPASRFVRTARPDEQGRFAISGLPAGTYRAIVRPFVENGEWEDPKFLEDARESGVRFVLDEGGAETLTLKLPGS